MTELEGVQLHNSRRKLSAILILAAASLLFWGQAAADNELVSSSTDKEIRVDGSLSEWEGIPALRISPKTPDMTVDGEFKEEDFDFQIKSFWNKQYLYLAIQWQDDVWDIEDVSRKNATWTDPD
jgi:hypothetical protein